MNPVPLSPELRAKAPEIARRFTTIMASLVALIARAFLRNPRLLPLIVPLYNRLNRAARRFSTLMARVAANKYPTPRTPTGEKRAGTRKPKPPIPTKHAWLILAIPYEAACFAGQLELLLAEHGVAELLAAVPTVQRILNPIRHALSLTPKPPWPKRTRKPAPKRPPAPRRTPMRPLYPTMQAIRPWPPRLIKRNPA